MKIQTNFFKLKFDNGSNHVYKYNVSFLPEIPDNSKMLRHKVVRSAFKSINGEIGQHIFIGSSIYAIKQHEDGFN